MDAQARYDSLFAYYGARSSMDPALLKAQAQQESQLNPDAQSPVGARGLCQFMDTTWASFAALFKHPSVWNAEQSIDAQARYMAELFRECKTVELTLAAYNWGIGHVRRTFLSVPGHTGYDASLVPPETHEYVQRILTKWRTP